MQAQSQIFTEKLNSKCRHIAKILLKHTVMAMKSELVMQAVQKPAIFKKQKEKMSKKVMSCWCRSVNP